MDFRKEKEAIVAICFTLILMAFDQRSIFFDLRKEKLKKTFYSQTFSLTKKKKQIFISIIYKE